jgi:hypothetical protein
VNRRRSARRAARRRTNAHADAPARVHCRARRDCPPQSPAPPGWIITSAAPRAPRRRALGEARMRKLRAGLDAEQPVLAPHSESGELHLTVVRTPGRCAR